MDLDTISGLVMALVSAYDAGLEYYTKWQRRKWQQNTYENHDRGVSGSGSCGLSASLSYSGPIIRHLFQSSAEALGDSFSIGDEQCRESLLENLQQLQARVDILHAAMTSDKVTLELFDTIRASEAVRVSTVGILTQQHQRIASSRPTSRGARGTMRNSSPDHFGTDEEVEHGIASPSTPTSPSPEGFAPTTHHATTAGKFTFRSEPLSPPPTPPKSKTDGV